MDDSPGGRPLRFRTAGPPDAAAVAALHASSRRRHYRGAYSDSYLDGDLPEERLAVWTERLGSAGARHPAMFLRVLEQNTGAQSFYDDRGGRRADKLPVPGPGGVPERLHGSPFALRYAWPAPSVLLT